MASHHLLVTVLACVVSAMDVLADASTLHHHMSADQLRQVFHVDSHDQVPAYEVVHVHSSNYNYPDDEVPPPVQPDVSYYTEPRAHDSVTTPQPETAREEKEDVTHLKLAAFGKKMRLKMKKATGLFKGEKLKMWAVEANITQPHQVEYVEQPEDHEEIGDIYQDEENMAALLLLQDKTDGSMAVEGTIGHDLVVKPVPTSLRHHLAPPSGGDDEMFLDAEGESLEDDVTMDTGLPVRIRRSKRSAQPTQQHIVYKRSMAHAQEDGGSDYAFMEPDHLAKRHRSKRSINKREAPYVIYPEILVIVDYDGYRLHGGDNVQIKRYFVSFWNGVDLRYKLLKGPKIRISIAGIIISRGRDATPYLERNRVGRDAIDSAAALTDMGKYLFRERRLPVYDIAVAVTKLDMCRRQYANDACNRGTAGFAYVGGACVVNKRLEKVNSVAIIEDTGGFSGIIVGAHEVGHLLGAVHDGSPPPSYLGGPGAEKCRWEDGFIMSDLRHTDKGFKWSPCSVTSFHHFLNGDTATCLYNSPHEDESLPRVLPGKLLTLDAQCRKDRGTSACFKDDRVCAQLFCFDAGSGYCVAYRPAAEGSSCGDGQYCINGRCTTEHENIIPDYSQNTPTYLRRNDADGAATETRPFFLNATTQRSSWDVDHSTQPLSVATSTSSPTTVVSSPIKHSFRLNLYAFTKAPTYAPSTVKTTTLNPYKYSKTSTTTTTANPYYKYDYSKTVPTTTASPYQKYEFSKTTPTTTTANPYFKYKYSTTKTQYNFNKASTTKNPYDFSDFHQTFSKKDIEIPPKLKLTTIPPPSSPSTKITVKPTTENPYYKYFRDLTSTNEPEIVLVTTKKQTNYNHYNQYYTSSTTERTTSSHTTRKEDYTVSVDTHAGDTECVDLVAKLSGSMSCRDFLQRYGYQYCPSSYMRRNCCATHRDVCLKLGSS